MLVTFVFKDNNSVQSNSLLIIVVAEHLNCAAVQCNIKVDDILEGDYYLSTSALG